MLFYLLATGGGLESLVSELQWRCDLITETKLASIQKISASTERGQIASLSPQNRSFSYRPERCPVDRSSQRARGRKGRSWSSSSIARGCSNPLDHLFLLLVARGGARHLPAPRRRLLDARRARRPPGLAQLRGQRPGDVGARRRGAPAPARGGRGGRARGGPAPSVPGQVARPRAHRRGARPGVPVPGAVGARRARAVL